MAEVPVELRKPKWCLQKHGWAAMVWVDGEWRCRACELEAEVESERTARREAEAYAENFRRGHDEILRANGTLAQQIDALIAAVEEHKSSVLADLVAYGDTPSWDMELWSRVRSISEGEADASY